MSSEAVTEEECVEIVETGEGREVRMSYEEGCRNYCLGFAGAYFMVAVLAGYAILWSQRVPESVFQISVLLFIVLSTIGFTTVVIAYRAPVRLYELLEGDSR